MATLNPHVMSWASVPRMLNSAEHTGSASIDRDCLWRNYHLDRSEWRFHRVPDRFIADLRERHLDFVYSGYKIIVFKRR